MITRIAIVEDNAGICEQLGNIIGRDPRLSCVAVCRNIESALKQIPPQRPDVIIMDIHLPDGSGIDCTTRLAQLLPDAEILMYTIQDDAEEIVHAMEAGATGYLLKDTKPADLLAAIHEVRTHGAPMSRDVARKLVESFRRPPAPATAHGEAALTPREQEILALLADGLLTKEIGDRLSIKYDTVGTHLKRIYRKLQVRSRTQAVMKYYR
jgi:DNA-binding NarL/FixJ family response regulator